MVGTRTPKLRAFLHNEQKDKSVKMCNFNASSWVILTVSRSRGYGEGLGKKAEYNTFMYNQAKKLSLKRCELLSAIQLIDSLEKAKNYEVAKCSAPGWLSAHLIHSRSTACAWKLWSTELWEFHQRSSSWTATHQYLFILSIQTR